MRRITNSAGSKVIIPRVALEDINRTPLEQIFSFRGSHSFDHHHSFRNHSLLLHPFYSIYSLFILKTMLSRQRWAASALPLIILVLLVIVVQLTSAQQDATCDGLEPCKSGCCSSAGKCGFGDAFCGDGCQGTCNATAECGRYAPEANFDCPLNVCCRSVEFMHEVN